MVLVALTLAGAACSRPGSGSGDSDGQQAAGSEAGENGKKKERDRNAGDDEKDKEEAVPVEIIELGRGRIETVLRFSTNLEAESEVTVVSQASRQLQVVQLLVEEGADVRKGQVLLRLQDDQLRTALERVSGQLARAEREYQRQTNLHGQQLISDQAYTEATYELEQLQLARKDAERELGYTEVRAPISGTITERHVSVGNQVTPNQPLFGIVDFDSIVARVYVPEKELWRVRPQLDARISSEAARGQERKGWVERIAPRVDPRSGTVKVTVAIPRSEALLPGMYVSVELVTDIEEDAVLVPKKALIYDADQIFVFRYLESEGGTENEPDADVESGDEDGAEVRKADGRVERLLVEARLEDRDHIEVGGALTEGDRIVIAGQAGLKNGSLVRLVESDFEAASSAAGGAEGPAEDPAESLEDDEEASL